MELSGDGHTLFLKDDTSVCSMGLNGSYQLGNGTTVTSKVPTRVLKADGTPLTNVIAIDGGHLSSTATDADGVVYAWGYNSTVSLGVGNTTNQKFAVQSNYPNLLYYK